MQTKTNTAPKLRFITSPPILLTFAILFWAGNTVIGKATNPLLPAFSLFLLALISVTAYNTFLYWALNWTTAMNVSVVCGTMPMVIFFLSWQSFFSKNRSRSLTWPVWF